jgi:hypothetical protein
MLLVTLAAIEQFDGLESGDGRRRVFIQFSDVLRAAVRIEQLPWIDEGNPGEFVQDSI